MAILAAMFTSGWLGLTLFAIDALVRAGLMLRVVMRGIKPSVSLSWIIILFFLPIVGPALYVIMGENRLGARRVLRFENKTRYFNDEMETRWRKRHVEWNADEECYAVLAKLGTALGGMPPLKGNTLDLMDDANLVLDRLKADIDSAKNHCHLLYYIWMPEGRGKDIGDALIEAAKRGVQCRVLVDWVGANGFLKCAECARMREAGVQVVGALPAGFLRMAFARLDLRNHRKIAVIDGLVAYCGSQNLTDKAFRNKRRKKVGPWIDTTVRITGPAVQALQTVFLRDWAAETDEKLKDPEEFYPTAQRTGSSIVHVVPSGPGPQPDAIRQALIAAVFAAREEIVMVTPYFVPDESMKTALINAAMRGVAVTLILPDTLDARLVEAASRAQFQDLLDAGVRIALHPEGLLHAKTATVDRKLGMVGSANLDMRSFWLNFEVTLFIYDGEFTDELRQQQRRYLKESIEINAKAWRKRSIVERFVDNLAQLAGPLL
ncbi:MAG: cardiolipin synthase [Phycisphaeraceae bacterium]|nr:cardiolipin synthase [Phycisphaeraceae bacterium]